jgi:hypothetical protein
MSLLGHQCFQHHYLLVAMGPDRRHSLKAVAFRAPASRLAALTGCRRPGRGLAMLVRKIVSGALGSCDKSRHMSAPTL